jgi:hypothetical protein
MIEIIILVAIVIILILLLINHGATSESRLVAEKEKVISRIEKMLKIAEKKFFKGKMKKEVFESLCDDLRSEKTYLELEIHSIKRASDVSVSEKSEELLGRAINPSKHKKIKLNSLLRETDLLRNEIHLLEVKLMKHELTENLFHKLVKEKENKLIRLESEIVEIVSGE